MKRTFVMALCMLVGMHLTSFAQYANPQMQGSAAPDQTKQTPSFPSGDQFKTAKLSYKIIPAANHTWCYDILAEGRMMIHQPSAPGLPGNEGFKTKAKAIKVAELVIEKIKKGEMPPSVSMEEMKKVGAL